MGMGGGRWGSLPSGVPVYAGPAVGQSCMGQVCSVGPGSLVAQRTSYAMRSVVHGEPVERALFLRSGTWPGVCLTPAQPAAWKQRVVCRTP